MFSKKIALLLVVALLMGLVAACGAFSYAECGARLPRTGAGKPDREAAAQMLQQTWHAHLEP